MQNRQARPRGAWRKSSRCESSTCVEVAVLTDVVGVRDTADPGGPELAFAPAQWAAFTTGLKSGQLTR
jgi:hypothetical protein